MLKDKKVLVIGMMSERSIAYGVAKSMHGFDAKIGFSCMQRFEERVKKISQDWNPFMVNVCDMAKDEDITNMAEEVARHGKIDAIVHSIAFAPRDHLEGGILKNMTREGFLMSHDISVYSLAAVTKALLPHMNDNGSVVALTYLGSSKIIPNYNVMGPCKASLESMVRYLAYECGSRNIRVNAISAGPVRTPAASGIKDMGLMLNRVALSSPIKKPITTEQIGNTAAFLCSDLSSGITGEVVFVDNGYHAMGVMAGVE
ncbi:MAG: enoyl-ACP reductase [Pseudomonadota bacterium]|nr:enoyl-ACP reductase [Pseudomonadota bacterium]